MRNLLLFSALLAFYFVIHFSFTRAEESKRDVELFGEACLKVGGSCLTQEEQQEEEGEENQYKTCEPASTQNQDCPNGAHCCMGQEKGETERVEREAPEEGSGRDKNTDGNHKTERKQGKMNQKRKSRKEADGQRMKKNEVKSKRVMAAEKKGNKGERGRKSGIRRVKKNKQPKRVGKGGKENANRGMRKKQKKTERKQNTKKATKDDEYRKIKKNRTFKDGSRQKQGKEERRRKNRKHTGKVQQKAKMGLKTQEGNEIRKHDDLPLTEVSLARHRKKCKGIKKCKKAGGKCKKQDCRIKETFVRGLCKGGCYCCVKGCKTRKGCKKAGGTCVKESECGADSKVVHKGCKAGCVCCVPDKVTSKPPKPPKPPTVPPPPPVNVCEPKDKCKAYHGTCKSLCQDTEVVVHDACSGEHCFCCAREENIGCPASTVCPGLCSNVCTGVVANLTCPGMNCLCCLDCHPKQSCQDHYGECKSRCTCDEEELVGGCSGGGCKCCVASIPTCTGHCNQDTCLYGPLCTTAFTVNQGSGCSGHPACRCCSH